MPVAEALIAGVGSRRAATRRLVGTIRDGYDDSPAAARGGFGILSSAAASIVAARTITYVRERKRNAPRLRDWARRAQASPGEESLRVHHFIPGIGLLLLSGSGAILERSDGREFWLGAAFGTGVGLTLDEFAILTELDNPYWESGRIALGQAGIAAIGAVALILRFHRTGGRQDGEPGPEIGPEPPGSEGN